MKLYADVPTRRSWQIVADVFILCWIAVCAWLGRAVHDQILQLQGPAGTLTSTGTTFRDNMHGAAEQLAEVPLVGSGLRAPFDSLAGTGSQLSSAGSSLSATVGQIAANTGLAVAIVPIVIVVAIWAVLRWRFVRRATRASRFVSAPGALELFALRALTNCRVDQLAAVSPDPAGAWRARDLQVLHQLALLELRSLGLAPRRIGP